jgi:hypothetical protein
LVNESNSTNFCGTGNWRLPTVAELFSIANDNRINPAIDMTYFPNTQSTGWYWTSMPTSFSAGFSWAISADFGYDNISLRNNNNYVRLVSESQN